MTASLIRRWLRETPAARPIVRPMMPVDRIIAIVTDAVDAGVLELNPDGRALVDHVQGFPPREEPTVGQLMRALDAARRVPS